MKKVFSHPEIEILSVGTDIITASVLSVESEGNLDLFGVSFPSLFN